MVIILKYEKINTLWKRDEKENIIGGEYSLPEFDMIDHWEVSEKVNGMTIRIILSKIEGKLKIKFAGRTDKSVIPQPLLGNLMKFFTKEQILKAFDVSKIDTKAILYCEGYGVKIQKGGKYIPDNQDVILFDVLIDGFWLESGQVTEIAELLEMKRVPIITEIWKKEDIVDFVKSKPESRLVEGVIMEGVVCRSKPLLLRRNGKRVIFKLKVKDYEALERRK